MIRREYVNRYDKEKRWNQVIEETGETRQVSKELIRYEEMGGGNNRVIRDSRDSWQASSDNTDKNYWV